MGSHGASRPTGYRERRCRRQRRQAAAFTVPSRALTGGEFFATHLDSLGGWSLSRFIHKVAHA
ncbi:hypothetical protein BN126330229 [Stenotrophomonas thermophila]|nr:hypothetical protein BN126330229 [Stenotrophomonas maltophilia]